MVVVMADVDITSLSVEISAESQGAELNIDKLPPFLICGRKATWQRFAVVLISYLLLFPLLNPHLLGWTVLAKITSFYERSC